jgi:hypothetical protein
MTVARAKNDLVASGPTHSRRTVKYAAGIVCCTAFLATWGRVAHLNGQALPESAVKAEMIRRFPEFVEWPAAALQGRDEITLCFSRSHPFGTVDGIARGPKILGHGVQVRELKRDDRLDGCHVLYVAAADQGLLEAAKGRPVLTIGDQKDFCQLGGIINLRVVDGRVRFEVNVARGKQSGFKFDSQFLRLATALYGGRP